MTKLQAIQHINKLHKKVMLPIGDLLLGRLVSKKLTVFIMATIFILRGLLDGDQWVTVAQWYITGQTLVDITNAIKKPKQTNEKP